MGKRILQLLFLSLLMLSMTCISGCGGDTPDKPNTETPTPDNPQPPQEPLPVPGLSFTSVTFPNAGDTFACIIHGLTDDKWNAESKESWCSVSVQGNLLKIAVSANSGSDNRSTTISLLHSDNRVIGKITVNQRSTINNEMIESSSMSRQSFYPMFTATWCPFSPDMDRTLIEIQKRWGRPIIPMRIHVKDSELYTPLSQELSQLYNNETTPTGYFENYFRVENMLDGNVSVDYFWNLILSKTSHNDDYSPSCGSLGSKAIMSENKIEAEISITPIKEGKYRLLVFIVEDNIIKAQNSKMEGEIPDYRHNGVLVGALTPLQGQELDLTTSQKSLTLAGEVPSGVNPSNLRLIVVLERNISILNYSDKCWYADNCISVPLGKTCGNGMIENIYIGEEIEN